MKQAERDELLIRIDERTRNTWTLTEKQEAHLSKLNDTVAENASQIASTKTGIKWIKLILIGAGLLLIGIVGGGITGLFQWVG